MNRYTLLVWNDRRITVRHILAASEDDAAARARLLQSPRARAKDDPRWQILNGHVEVTSQVEVGLRMAGADF